MQRPSLWLPTNTCEYLFYNDFGELAINEEAVKALSMDFTNIMKGVYEDLQAKYEQAINGILQDSDLEGIDFPLVTNKVQTMSLADVLSPELVEKLNI